MAEGKTFSGSPPTGEGKRARNESPGEINIFCVTGVATGRRYRMMPGQVLFAGRSSNCEIQLDENLVSRRHAKFSYIDDVLRLQDLGSTNGTFVNGRKVDAGELASGDRVQIGEALLKIYFAGQSSADLSDIFALADAMAQREGKGTGGRKGFSGNLSLLPLPDILQMMSANRATGQLDLQRRGEIGRIWFREGTLVTAAAGRVKGKKALYRILGWNDADFEFSTQMTIEPSDEIGMDISNLLMEGFTHLDEMGNIKDEIPPRHVALSIVNPDESKFAQLPKPVRKVLAAILQHQYVGEVVDHVPMTDLDTYRILIALRKKGVITVKAPRGRS